MQQFYILIQLILLGRNFAIARCLCEKNVRYAQYFGETKLL